MNIRPGQQFRDKSYPDDTLTILGVFAESHAGDAQQVTYVWDDDPTDSPFTRHIDNFERHFELVQGVLS